MDVTHDILPVILFVGELLLITSIYTVVRQFYSNHSVVLLVIGFIGAVTVLTIGLGIESLGILAKASTQYVELKSMDSTLPHVHFSRHDRKFFRSCQTLNFKVLEAFTLEKDTFIKIMERIVISSVIDLLVAF